MAYYLFENTIDANQVFGSHVDVHTLEKNIVGTARSEVDSLMTTVGSGV